MIKTGQKCSMENMTENFHFYVKIFPKNLKNKRKFNNWNVIKNKLRCLRFNYIFMGFEI